MGLSLHTHRIMCRVKISDLTKCLSVSDDFYHSITRLTPLARDESLIPPWWRFGFVLCRLQLQMHPCRGVCQARTLHERLRQDDIQGVKLLKLRNLNGPSHLVCANVQDLTSQLGGTRGMYGTMHKRRGLCGMNTYWKYFALALKSSQGTYIT